MSRISAADALQKILEADSDISDSDVESEW